MLSAILPPGVIVAEARGLLPRTPLLPDEAPAVANAVRRRRLEFEAGRYLARQALQQLGHPAVAIPQGPDREPVWPIGIVGSITHCGGYCAVAVAAADRAVAIGIDAELRAELDEGVLRLVARPEERAWMGRQSDPAVWGPLLFSAKESVYKAWFPLTGRSLDFSAASIRFDQERQTFRAALDEPVTSGGRTLDHLDGAYLIDDTYLVTAVAIPA